MDVDDAALVVLCAGFSFRDLRVSLVQDCSQVQVTCCVLSACTLREFELATNLQNQKTKVQVDGKISGGKR